MAVVSVAGCNSDQWCNRLHRGAKSRRETAGCQTRADDWQHFDRSSPAV